MIDAAQVYSVTTSGTNSFTKEIENSLNECIDAELQKERETSIKTSYDRIIKNNSVKFSSESDSIVLDEYNYENDEYRNTEKPVSADLDTVKSGESLIKYYNFDESKYNTDTNKCAAFWKTLREKDLKPVECVFKMKNLATKNHKGAGRESLPNKTEQFIWYNALLDMKKRKMDQLALAAAGTFCKICDHDSKLAKSICTGDLKDDEDLIELNTWDPNANKKIKPDSERKLINRGDSFDLEDDGDTCSCYKEECVCPPVKEEEPVSIIPEDRETLCMPVLVKHTMYDKAAIFPKKRFSPVASSKPLEINTLITTENHIDCFEEADAIFLKELRYQLQHIRKDKSCSTEDDAAIYFTIPATDCKKPIVSNNSQKDVNALVTDTKEKTLNINQIYGSSSDTRSRSTTLLSLGKKQKKGTFNSGLSGSCPTLKEISTIPRTNSTAATRTDFDNSFATTIDTFISDDNLKKSENIENNQQRQMLWYSSKIPYNL
ncbi:hypothetical protein FQR65_LT03395 [Abscondita terminalis]|nr:hypothetical protein FQR65_LT03395 [Abscondita terminalis]